MELDTVHTVAVLGFLGAMVFGAIASKTHFCIMGSISDWINMGSKTRFRAWMLALGIAVVGTQLMSAMGWFDLRQSIYLRTDFGWLGYLLGGFMFGVGMTLGAGCGQRTLVRVGGGNLKSLIVLLVLALTAYMTLRGLFAVLRIEVIQASNIDLSERGLVDQSIATFLSAFTGLSPRWAIYVTAGVFGLGAIIYALKDKTFRRSFDNVLVGVVVGTLIAAAWYVTGVIGNDEFEPVPLEAVSFIAPAGNTLNYLMTYTGSVINFGVAVVLGMIAGSFVYAIASGTFRIETFVSRGDMINHLYAGALMGVGGVLSLGCTIGQGVSGMSTLALGSLITLVSIVLGSATTLKMQYYMLDEGFLPSLRQTLADFKLLRSPQKST